MISRFQLLFYIESQYLLPLWCFTMTEILKWVILYFAIFRKKKCALLIFSMYDIEGNIVLISSISGSNTTQNMKFSITDFFRTSSAVFCGFGHIY